MPYERLTAYRVLERARKALRQAISDHGGNPSVRRDSVDGNLLSASLTERGRLVSKRLQLGAMQLHASERQELGQLVLVGQQDRSGSARHVPSVNHGKGRRAVTGNWPRDLSCSLGLAC